MQVWSPPDPSARDMLLPWKQVWSAAAWKDITTRAVVPQLEAAMHHVLNLYPHQLNVAPCEWCSAWVELLSAKQLAGEARLLMLCSVQSSSLLQHGVRFQCRDCLFVSWSMFHRAWLLHTHAKTFWLCMQEFTRENSSPNYMKCFISGL